MRTLPNLCVIALVILAGCSSPPKQDREPSTSITQSSTSTTSMRPLVTLPQPTSLPEEIRWTDCTGFYTGITLPRGANPMSPPPAWEEDPTEVTTRVLLWLVECNRLSWGSIERGPIRMMLEYANEGLPPENCLDSEAPPPWLLSSWWLDDQGAVDHLLTVEGLPVKFATFEHQEDFAETSTMSWSWQTQSAESSLQAVQAGPESGDGLPDARLFWSHGNELSYVDLSFEYKARGPIDGAVTGSISDQLLLGQLAGGVYAGTALILTDAQLTGHVQRFKDLACEQSY